MTENIERRKFIKKAGLASLGAAGLYVVPQMLTINSKTAYAAMSAGLVETPTPTSNPRPQATSTSQPKATSTPQPTATSTPQPKATSTPQSQPKVDNNISFYTWNTDGWYYHVYYGKRDKVVQSVDGPGTYIFPDDWVHP